MTNEDVDIIETNIIFATEVKVIVKIRKSTSYGNPNPGYKLAEVAGVVIRSDDEETKRDIVRKIEYDALLAVEDYEKKMNEK